MKNTIRKDILFYSAGTIIPTIIGVLRSPVFTRYFSSSEYGYYSIVTIAFSFMSLILFTSLSGCIWRYYFKFKNEGTIISLYSNLAFLYLISFIIILGISITWLTLSDLTVIRNLVILCFINYFTAEIIAFYLIIYKIESKAYTYNLIQTIKTSLSFILLLVMTFIFKFRIEALLISGIIVQTIVIIYLFFFSKLGVRIDLKQVSYNNIKELGNYGFSGVLINASLIVLISADRYIIKIYSGFSEVGIYNQIYNLGQISIAAMATVYTGTISPKLTMVFEEHLKSSERVLKLFIKNFILILLPITVYFSIFSEQLAFVMLGKEFRIGYTMIPFIMFSSFFYGILQPLMLKLKFENKLNLMILCTVLSASINVLLNFILIPVFNYKIAAFVTFLSYTLLLFLIIYFGKIRLFKEKTFIKFLVKILLVLIIQALFDFFIRHILFIKISFVLSLIEAIIFIISLYLIVSKSEVKYFLNNIKNSIGIK